MKKRMLLLSCLLIPALLLTVGTSFSWMVNRSDNGSAQAGTASVRTKLDFGLNTHYGIPGETIALTDAENGSHRLTNEGTGDYIFKLSYTVYYPDGDSIESIEPLPFITALSLADADKLGLIRSGDGYDKDSRTLVYYGRHDKSNGPLPLGELHATFDILKNIDMGKPFTVDAEVEACQATEAAVSDVLGIDASMESGKYAALFSVGGVIR